MRPVAKPSTYLSIEEIQQIAAAKFEEAAALPPGPEQQAILRSAHSYRSLAEMKGWLSGDLRSPE